MIVRPRPGLFGLLFAVRGSVVPRIGGRVLLVVAVSVLVTAGHRLRPGLVPALPPLPFTLLGLGLSVFLGFRNGACYDRWWEARRQWGQLLAEVRSLSRRLAAVWPEDGPGDGSTGTCGHRRASRRLLGFAHALAARLRGGDAVAAAVPWLDPAEARALAGRANPPDAILRRLSAELAARARAGELDAIGLAALEAHVVALCGVQAACERIRSTPTPFAYTLLLHRTAWLFCLLVPFALVEAVGVAAPLAVALLGYAFFGLDALGEELEEPFGTNLNALPLDAMVRTMEIELREAMGETELPEPLRPVEFVLR